MADGSVADAPSATSGALLDEREVPVQVCLLGSFRVAKHGVPVPLRTGGKTEQFLGALALQPREGIARDELLGLVWPETERALATQSLNTLVHAVNRTLGGTLDGPPIVRRGGRYRLNIDAGVVVDVHAFDAAAEVGDRLDRQGDRRGAMDSYDGAVGLYEGDLVIASDVRHVLERERLRARYLSVRAKLADHHFGMGHYTVALMHALDLLAHDPCREDAHRMVMRCHVRRGERAQALRQYRVCQSLLALEFDARPEPATDALYELVRLDPAHV